MSSLYSTSHHAHMMMMMMPNWRTAASGNMMRAKSFRNLQWKTEEAKYMRSVFTDMNSLSVPFYMLMVPVNIIVVSKGASVTEQPGSTGLLSPLASALGFLHNLS